MILTYISRIRITIWSPLHVNIILIILIIFVLKLRLCNLQYVYFHPLESKETLYMSYTYSVLLSFPITRVLPGGTTRKYSEFERKSKFLYKSGPFLDHPSVTNVGTWICAIPVQISPNSAVGTWICLIILFVYSDPRFNLHFLETKFSLLSS